MSEPEKLASFVQRVSQRRPHLQAVEPLQEVATEQTQEVLAPDPLVFQPSVRRQTTRPPLSFDRFRRPQRPHVTSQGEMILPAPYEVPKKDVCPNCQGLGFLRKNVPHGHPDFGKAQPCYCTIKQRLTQLGFAQIPEEYQDYSFDTYLQQPLPATQEEMCLSVMQFVMDRLTGTAPREKRGLYLSGPLGVGKTGLAVAALREAIAAGKSGLYLSTAALFDILRESIAASQRLMRGYGEEEDKQEEVAGTKILRQVEAVEWLVLDDLGVECGSEFVVHRLYRIIEERRLRKHLYTIFTSNKDAAGLEARWRSGKHRMGAFEDCYRVIDRLGEYCVTFSLEGQNLRRKEEEPVSGV